MKRFFEPESVAVIGASSDPNKGGYALVDNLKVKFPKRLYPVNPRGGEICGLQCFRSVGDLPETVDLAVVFVPAPSVPTILEQCGAEGVRHVMIQSAGFAETGEQGIALQESCVQVANRHSMRLWGPNCMGVVNARSGMVASFMRPDIWRGYLQAGEVSLVVQSGMLSAGFLVQILREGYFGLSKACSIGNRSDVDESDLLEYFRDDPETSVVGLYLESVAHARRFRKAVESLGKPVVLLKGGVTPQGAQAAKSHTASLAQDGPVAEGFFRQLGIHRAFDFLEWIQVTRSLALWKGKEGGERVGIVTFSGASGTVATDHLIQRGMSLACLSETTREALGTILPPWAGRGNPVDLWPAIERVGRGKAYEVALQAILADPGVDALYVHTYVDPTVLKEIGDALSRLGCSTKPVALWIMGDPLCFRSVRDSGGSIGVPVFTEVQEGVKALRALTRGKADTGQIGGG